MSLESMSAKFRVLRTTINLRPDNVEKVVKACLVLHNYIRKRRENDSVNREDHITGHLIRGAWRHEDPLQHHGDRGKKHSAFVKVAPRRPGQEAQRTLEELKKFFLNEGKVPWQRLMCQLE